MTEVTGTSAGEPRMVASNCLATGHRRAALGLLWQPLQPGLSIRDQARLFRGHRRQCRRVGR